MHPLNCALPGPYVPVRVTRGALVANLYTYTPPRSRTSQYRITFIPVSLSPWGQIIKTLVKLQCSAHCISSYNMKATMCQQCCKSESSKIYKSIVGRLYVLLRRAHCSKHTATYNMQQPIRKRVTNYLNQLKQFEFFLFPQARHHCL